MGPIILSNNIPVIAYYDRTNKIPKTTSTTNMNCLLASPFLLLVGLKASLINWKVEPMNTKGSNSVIILTTQDKKNLLSNAVSKEAKNIYTRQKTKTPTKTAKLPNKQCFLHSP
ncbi:PMS1 protein-like protein [Corchorus olitorius]|uniref:PMS1 protein-like protein n=1 Tax=Corchorus olitorius TaxID=93759 RepID=A0A1R3ISL9_9ROSI|nr:PMS1 protein-like protein [Corchorus olitorius]